MDGLSGLQTDAVSYLALFVVQRRHVCTRADVGGFQYRGEVCVCASDTLSPCHIHLLVRPRHERPAQGPWLQLQVSLLQKEGQDELQDRLS